MNKLIEIIKSELQTFTINEVFNNSKEMLYQDVVEFVRRNNYESLISSCDLSKGNCDTVVRKLYQYLLGIGYDENKLMEIELSYPKFDLTDAHQEWQKYDRKFLTHVVLQVGDLFVDLTGSQYSNNQSGIQIYGKQELSTLWTYYKIMKKDGDGKYLGGTYSNAKTRKF